MICHRTPNHKNYIYLQSGVDKTKPAGRFPAGFVLFFKLLYLLKMQSFPPHGSISSNALFYDHFQPEGTLDSPTVENGNIKNIS